MTRSEWWSGTKYATLPASESPPPTPTGTLTTSWLSSTTVMLPPSAAPSLVSTRVLGAHLFSPRTFSVGAFHRHTWDFHRLHRPTSIHRGWLLLQPRPFSTSPSGSVALPASSESSPNDSQKLSASPPKSESTPPTAPQRPLLARFIPSSLLKGDTAKSASSFRKIVSLAKPERKPLGIAIGLLLVSSSVSMSIPFTIGKLIDYFTSTHPVSTLILSSCFPSLW